VQTRHELVFVETNTPHYEELVGGIQAHSHNERNIEVILLDPSGDGVAQISSILSRRTDVSAVHLIAHGADGQVQLGAATLNFDSLLKNAAKIKAWGQALSGDADFLIYGCNVAQAADGKALIDALARLTGADVAASEDLTGSKQLGGNWALEYVNGQIDTCNVVPGSVEDEWQYTLSSYTVSNANGAAAVNSALAGITPVNDAPVLNGANNMNRIDEDAVVNPGTLVSALIAGMTSDADVGALSGIAVTDVQNGSGSWKYSTDGAKTWQPFPIGTITPSSALLLAADAKTYIRFTPTPDWNGTKVDALSFRAWDQTSGTAGGTADTTINGGATAFSTAIRSASITVASVNDAPLGADKTITIFEQATYTFLAIDFGFTDPRDSPGNNLEAVKITTIVGAGSLTLSGAAVSLGQLVSGSSIAAGDLKFTPAANGAGASYAGFTFEAKDDGGTTNGGVDSDPTPNTITINVTPVNDAPSGTDKTVSMLEDTAYAFTALDFGFTDPNDIPANTLAGVKITRIPSAGVLNLSGLTVTAGQSISRASIDAGSLQFAPSHNGAGADYASFTFQVQDDGGKLNGGVDTDISARTMRIDVTSVNDAPVSGNATVVAVENGPYTFAAVDFGFTDPYDRPANGLNAVQIVTLPMAGTITLSGVNVTAGEMIPVTSLALGALKYAPPPNFTGVGAASFQFKLQDNGGRANGGNDLEVVSHTITINVAPVSPGPTATPTAIATGSVLPVAPIPGATSSVPVLAQSLDGPVLFQQTAESMRTTVGGTNTGPTADVGRVIAQSFETSSQESPTETGQREKVSLRGIAASETLQPGVQVLQGKISTRDSHGSIPALRLLGVPFAQAGASPAIVPMFNVSIMDPAFGRDGLHYSVQTPPSPLNSGAWAQELNRVREAQAASMEAHQRLMASTIVVSAGMSVGYVVWLLRGGLLLGSLLSSLPAWQVIDPLPVLARSKRIADEAPGADPLEHLFGRVRAIMGGIGEISLAKGQEQPSKRPIMNEYGQVGDVLLTYSEPAT
jgi:Domain of unknown function (DUF4347)/Bacterial cadherin-like domain